MTCFVMNAIAFIVVFFFFKQKTAYEMRISDWSSDVCSSDLDLAVFQLHRGGATEDRHRHLEAGALFVDFLHHARERRERAIGHTHLLAHFEGDRGDRKSVV